MDKRSRKEITSVYVNLKDHFDALLAEREKLFNERHQNIIAVLSEKAHATEERMKNKIAIWSLGAAVFLGLITLIVKLWK